MTTKIEKLTEELRHVTNVLITRVLREQKVYLLQALFESRTDESILRIYVDINVSEDCDVELLAAWCSLEKSDTPNTVQIWFNAEPFNSISYYSLIEVVLSKGPPTTLCHGD